MTKGHEGDPRDIDTADIEADAVSANAGSSRLKWVAMLLGLVAVAAIAYAVTTFVGQREDAQQDERRAQATTQVVGDQATDQSDRILAICEADTDEAKTLEDAGLCGKATETKDLVEKRVPAAGARDGVDGQNATTAQVFAAVQRFGPAGIAAYCARNDDCQGDSGGAGTDGDDVTQGELEATVRQGTPPLLAAFCAASNGCRGLPGPKGDTGATGATGKAGTDGKPGASTNGKDGAPAPVITSSVCNDDAQIVLTFDNNTSIVVADSVCRVALLP